MKRRRRIFTSLQSRYGPQDVLEDRYLSNIAGQRLQAIRDGSDELIDAQDFWAKADRIMGRKK